MSVSAGKARFNGRSVTAWRRASIIIALTLGPAACKLPYIPPYTSPPPAAVAHLVDSGGRAVGNAVMLQEGGSVRILIDLSGLPPGAKAVHIHEVGRCEPPSFESAGAHFNPKKAEHGTVNSRGPHAGDLPNIIVDATGRGHLEVSATRVTLEKGSASLFDADGSALVVHESPDDMRTDPEGTSGKRVACGVIGSAQ